ncbi:centrosomal protein of 295 kDa isoform X3 [Ascaphus truei]
MYTEKMIRKVAKVGALRVSPNEEAVLLKQERERRRKLRLQQVREQEKSIAQQIRQDVKQRRDQQLQQLAEELRAEWQAAQAEKLKALERVYLSSLKAIGEGHRQAKENEPDFQAIEKQVAANNERAEKRYRGALRELKQHKVKQLKQQTWHIKARKKALIIEKERAANIASLPPPPPDPVENLEVVKRPPTVRICDVEGLSVSHYHLPELYVDREMDTEQPDARASAEEEAKRLDDLQKEEERERREQSEKAHLRGSHALKMVHLQQDRDKLLKELEQMQQGDLARRRQIVAQMPPQLFEPAYRRAEIREDWQRELESVFEDMYTGDRRVRGDLVLHLQPQPLPVPSVKSADEDLDLSMEPEHVSEMQQRSGSTEEETHLHKPGALVVKQTNEAPSRLVLRRLLHKIRTQKDQWTSKNDVETASNTLESGSLPSEEGKLKVKHRAEKEEGNKAVAAAPEPQDLTANTVLAGNSILLHPQEQAVRIRMATDRQTQLENIEQQKREQLDLLKKLEEQRLSLEAEFLKVKLQMQEAKREELEAQAHSCPQEEEPEPVDLVTPVSESCSTDNQHLQMIRDYQQRLLQQNRQHKQSVDEARKRLEEYQLLLKKRYPNLSSSHVGPPAGNQTNRNLKPILKAHTSEKFPTTPKSPHEDNTNPSNLNVRLSSLTEKPNGNVEVARPMSAPSLSAPVSHAGQEFLQSVPLNPFLSAPITKSTEFGQPNARNLSTSQGVAVFIPSSSKDLSVITVGQPPAWPRRFTESEKGPLNADHFLNSTVTVQQTDSCEGRHPQVMNFSIATENQIPQAGSVGPQHAFTIPEKQSSVSMLSIHDAATEIFHPLPSALTFGQPQMDSVLAPEHSGPLAIQELHAKREDNRPFADFSNVVEFRERLFSTAEVQAQQNQLREMQLQLDQQRESLMSKQRIQEEHLLQKQKELEEQMRNHQESLEHFLGTKESGEGTLPADFCQIPKNERFQLMSALLKALESNSHEDTGLGIGSELTVPGREQRWKPSKPPVTKTKLGPLLEQHELSAIQEVETPTNGRRSSTGIVENSDSRSGSKDGTEEKYFVPTDYDPENSRMNSSSDSSHRDLDLSRISTSGKDQNSNESTTSLRSRAGRISWREALTLEATTSHDLGTTDQSQHCLVQQGLLRYAADAEKGLLVRPTVQERFDWLGAAVQVKNDLPFSPQAHTQEASYDYLSTTTISTGSFLTSEKTDSSPINSECLSDLQKCNYSVVGEAAYSNLSPVAANLLPHQMRWQMSRSPESPRHAEAERSHIQQIIEKYTKDLGASMERNLSFHAPFAAVDISTTEDKHFPPAFHTLEPKPDFNISTPSYPRSDNTGSSRDIKDFSQCSMYSHSQERSSPRSRVSYFQDNSNSLRSSPNWSNSQNVALATEASVKESRTLDSFESFHSLHPECTLNEPNPSDQDHAMSNTATSKFSVYGLDHFIARTPTKPGLAPSHVNSHELEANSRPPILRLSAEIPRAEREHLLEDTGSRNELMATQVTVNESALSEHPIADFLEQRNVGSSFAELPFVDQELHQEAITKTMVDDLYSHEETESQLPLGQTSHSSTIVGAVLESSNLTLKSEILTDVSHAGSSENRNSLSAFTISSSTCSLPSCIPIWETESGRGIMEEPDLTLMSFNDSSVTTIDSDPIDTMRSICDRETLSASECDFLPLPPEVDASIFTIPDCASAGPRFTDKSSSQHFAALDLDFTSSPGNLQEAFLKKKKHFIEKSSKRLEEIKQKERGAKKVDLRSTQNDTSNAQLAQSLCSGAAQADGQFKKVVEVKVCTPEDRKLSEMEMRQRTIRLYNQLDEVKTRKEERMRQESYTRNREKAKQFKKKTLENLRVRR